MSLWLTYWRLINRIEWSSLSQETYCNCTNVQMNVEPILKRKKHFFLNETLFNKSLWTKNDHGNYLFLFLRFYALFSYSSRIHLDTSFITTPICSNYDGMSEWPWGWDSNSHPNSRSFFFDSRIYHNNCNSSRLLVCSLFISSWCRSPNKECIGAMIFVSCHTFFFLNTNFAWSLVQRALSSSMILYYETKDSFAVTIHIHVYVRLYLDCHYLVIVANFIHTFNYQHNYFYQSKIIILDVCIF